MNVLALSRDEEVVDENIGIVKNEALITGNNHLLEAEQTIDGQIDHISESLNSSMGSMESTSRSESEQLL